MKKADSRQNRKGAEPLISSQIWVILKKILVQTNNLTKQYGQHKAVNIVNLSVKKGEIYGLTGINGAGKTTVLRLISGLAKPTEWDICLFEHNSNDTVYAKNRVGILIENPGIYPNMSAKDNVKLKCLAMGVLGKSYIAGLMGGLHGQWR